MSSLIFLGFSIIMFVVSYGVMWMIVPMVLGLFFSVDVGITDLGWQQTQQEVEDTVRWLIPLVPTLGIFVFIIKVMMAASARGRD